ncbi:MAG: zinc ribbon domain-containing protein [Gemmatimonadaceae bacterium]|nr:zinc ribbon domain-containing protein [Gemmatimonadaceae bacterium]
MPIYEYACRWCGHQFETLVRAREVPKCPSCGTEDLERLLSLPVVKSETTRAQALAAARRRDKALGHERTQEQLKYERSHND